MRARRPAAVVFVALFASLQCAAPPAPWNVLFVLVDTLRADRMSLYGGARATTPFLDRFAADGVVFENAFSQAGCTFPSVNSLLTSWRPHRFLRKLDEHGMAIPPDVPVLPEILQQEGWSTAAVSASVIVGRTPSRINRQGGFGRGFDRFDESCREKRAVCVNRRAAAALDELEEPFFLYLHYLEPHGPYQPPLWHEREIAGDGVGLGHWARSGELQPVFDALYGDGDPSILTPERVDHLRDLYDEEILFFDRRFEELIAELRERDLLDRTLIVLLSDHGEELYDHGDFGHCRDLAWDTLLHVPLVLWLPDESHTGRRSAAVQNLDLTPTVLELLGLTPPEGIDGASMLPALADDRPLHRALLATQGRTRVLRAGELKLHFDAGDRSVRLFDVDEDPGERRDLAPERPTRARELVAALHRLLALDEADHDATARQAAELEATLERLGYL